MRTITTVLLVAALGAGLGAGCSSESTPTKKASTTTSLQLPKPSINPDRIGAPYAMQQRFGLGASWQMTAVKARLADGTVTAELDLYNGTEAAIEIPTDVKSMFTVRDWFGGKDIAAASATATPNPVPPGTNTRVVVTFTSFPDDAKDPILVFRGKKLNDSLNAAVGLDFS